MSATAVQTPSVQTEAAKKAVLTCLLPGYKIRLLFDHKTNIIELETLRKLSEGEQPLITLEQKTQEAIRLVLGSRESRWWNDGPEARTFEFVVTKHFSYDLFLQELPGKLFERIERVESSAS